ncbi:helix-turn-helix domain-containing protein [Streptomyces sp. NPDC004237]|uniref:winged helix-turn-helix transcriptional regulator n=1 Tax=Streptomyces sp. NPDC004237 TaxID=3154455 RepID=UPI0033A7A0BD
MEPVPHTVAAHESGTKQVDHAVARALELFGKRWTGLIVAVLLGGPAHFAELRRGIPGISERMLSDRLTELGAAQLVVREVHGGPPLRVSYRLTEAGAALESVFKELSRWAKRHLRESQQSSAADDKPAACVSTCRRGPPISRGP